jgi:uncharacterized protein YehS (DUF1456 family)
VSNNDLLRSLRYALNVNDSGMAAIFALGDCEVDLEFVEGLLAREEDDGFIECGDTVASRFLDGLIIRRRGPPKPGLPAPDPRARLNNNVILRKLRIAFELKDDDLHEILTAGEFPMSKSELSALFRAPGHPNYRQGGDQMMRHFLRGLGIWARRNR